MKQITRAYALYALGVIFIANFLNYLDRQLVSALETELSGAFSLDQKMFGALWTAFTVGYMIFAPVVGYLSDRYRRTTIFAVCVLLWSLATVWSGWATLRPELYAARFFIGIGEAGCLVIGPTLIADYFSRQVRGRALGVFYLGLPLGGVAGYLVGALASQYLGPENGWRTAFYIAGFPGIGLALVVWMLVDPPRREGAAEVHGHGPLPPDPSPEAAPAVDAAMHGHGHAKARGIGSYLALLKNRTLLLIILAQAFAVVILVPLLHFGKRFMETKFQMKPVEAAITLGSMMFAGVIATALSGVVGDLLAKRVRGAYALLAGCSYTFGLPCLLVGATTDNRWVLTISLLLAAFCFFISMPAVNTQIANVVAAPQRAMAYALAVFILHLLGDTTAPIAFGAVADSWKRFDGDYLGTQWAFVAFSFSLLLAGSSCFLAAFTARRDEAAAVKPDA